MDDDEGEVRRALEAALGEARRDWLLGTGLTVLLAPVFLAGAIVALLFTLGSRIPLGRLGDGVGLGAVPLFLEVALGYLLVGLFFGERGKARGELIAGAAGGIVALAFLAHGTSLMTQAPGAFWSVYGLGVLSILGVMGYAYTPRDDYHLGIAGTSVDNPLTLRDDVDRAHLGLGFAVAIPRFVLGAIGDIIAGRWALAGLEPREVDAAARAVLGLGRGDPGAMTPIRALGPTGTARVMRALVGCKVLAAGASVARLSPQGSRLVASSGASLAPRPTPPDDADSRRRGDPSQARGGREPV